MSPELGLVNVCGNGIYHDPDWTLMMHPAQMLCSVLEAMALADAQIKTQAGIQLALRERIGRLGREGEAAMLEIADDISTHYGAIWALGLLATAATQTPPVVDAATIARRATRPVDIPNRFTSVLTGHRGERTCNGYGVGGTRGRAYAGFPHVIKVVLPTLREARAAGVREDHAHVGALPAVMTMLDDTCALVRSGAKAPHIV